MFDRANLHSLEALEHFRTALIIFFHDVQETLDSFSLEVRRDLEWFTHFQPGVWKANLRSAEEQLIAAKRELEFHQSVQLDQRGGASQLQKQVEHAKQKVQYCEDKIIAVRKWGQIVEHETEEYRGRSSQSKNEFEARAPKAIAELDRAIAAIHAYLTVAGPSSPSAPAAAASDGTSMAQPIAEPARSKKPVESRIESPPEPAP